MNTLQWVSDSGHYLTFCDKPPFVLSKNLFQTLGGAAQTIKAALQDGQRTFIKTLDGRTINIEFTVLANGNSGLESSKLLTEYNNQLAEAFLPNTFGSLIYTTPAGARYIRVRAVTTPTLASSGYNWEKMEIELAADKPYWEDTAIISEKIGSVIKKFKFPLTFPFTVGKRTNTAIFKNPQSYDISPLFIVRSQLSTVTITNITTGEAMTVTHALAAGQEMYIDTYSYTVSLYAGGVYQSDISNWLDGDFIKLAPGENEIAVTTDVTDDIPDVYIKYLVPVWGV